MDALEMALLLDYYGGLLTDKQRDCFDMRYNQDLSLGEIAEILGVSRQAVNDNLSRTEAQLRKLEQKLGCISRDRRNHRALEKIQAAAQVLSSHPDKDVSDLGRQILAAAQGVEE